jgi:hypothetical protein
MTRRERNENRNSGVGGRRETVQAAESGGENGVAAKSACGGEEENNGYGVKIS